MDRAPPAVAKCDHHAEIVPEGYDTFADPREDQVMYRLLDDATVTVHFAFMVYVVLGGYLAWRRPATVWAHLACAGWGLATIVFGLHCPLTFVENWSRRRAGEAPLRGGFIDTYLTGVLYPTSAKTAVLCLVIAAVAASWMGLLWRVRHR